MVKCINIYWDNEKNVKQLIYIYKIYPTIKQDIVYFRWILSNIWKVNLLITEVYFSSNQENIILISKSYQNFNYINQEFISLIGKFELNIKFKVFYWRR